MINIIVNGLPAVVAKDSSFEYTEENNAFSQNSGYSMNIDFPLRGCEMNRKIFDALFIPAIPAPQILFSCSIQSQNFYAEGALSVMEITEEKISAQFLLNVAADEDEDILDKTFINELDLGEYPETDPGKFPPTSNVLNFCYLFAWAPFDSDIVNNLASQDGKSWDENTKYLTWCPKLVSIVQGILSNIGYSFDDSYITNLMPFNHWQEAIVCNMLPPTWKMPKFADALPDWSVSEFFEKLGIFYGLNFKFDHVRKKVNVMPLRMEEEQAGIFTVEKPISQFSASVNRDEQDADYLPVIKMKYRDNDSELWKYLSCPEYMYRLKKGGGKFLDTGGILEFNTWEDLRKEAKDASIWTNQGKRKSAASCLCYVKELDCHFIMRYHCTKASVFNVSGAEYVKFGELTPVNVFGPPEYDPDDELKELDFCPAVVDYTLDGKFLQLPVGELDGEDAEFASSDNAYVGILDTEQNIFKADNVLVWQSVTAQAIENYEEENKEAFFDRIFIGYPDVNLLNVPFNKRHPHIDLEIDRYDLLKPTDLNYLRIKDRFVGFASDRKIDPKVCYEFSFNATTFPNVKAIFLINGVRYVCKSLTAKFTESGMDPIIKGKFYRLVNDE